MKLLIVDDEALTRTGLISSVDWKALGIHEIYRADDGYHGLEMARLHSPEIILCDVRMPRMDGIDMLQRIEEFLPDSVAIFMSGYSDKEYLKAAIRLKAITYIEKPLDPKEVTAAIQEACKSYQQRSVPTGARLCTPWLRPLFWPAAYNPLRRQSERDRGSHRGAFPAHYAGHRFYCLYRQPACRF